MISFESDLQLAREHYDTDAGLWPSLPGTLVAAARALPHVVKLGRRPICLSSSVCLPVSPIADG
jgi:hypothetical protein